MDNIERNVIKNSEYIIDYYNRKDKEITNLELQKLIYFLEAIYMVSTDEEYLFEEQFTAWNFGPVNLEIYNHYKRFGRIPIELENEVNINSQNLKYIENLYELFKDFNATQLVNLSHSKGSPWYTIYSKNNGSIPRSEIISKSETKSWFSSLVKRENEQK